MFENIDLSRPFKDPLVVALQLLQNSAVLRGLLQVWKGDAGSQVDFITQWLVFIIVVEVLGVLDVVGWVWSDGKVVRSAVEVITTVRSSSVLLDDLLADAQHGGEENAVGLEPVHVGIPGDRGAEERSEVIVSIDDAEKPIGAVSLPAQIVVSVANLEPSQPPPGDGLVLEKVASRGEAGEEEESQAEETGWLELFHCQ